MKTGLFIIGVLIKCVVLGQAIPGHLLQRNGIDSTEKTLLVNIYAASCKNCIYLNRDVYTNAALTGYKTYLNISGLAKEDLDEFKEENSFSTDYPIVLDKELGQTIEQGSVYLLQGTKVLYHTDCENTKSLNQYFDDRQGKKVKTDEQQRVDSVLVDSSYKFYSGSAAYLNREYCLVMDLRFNKKLHKINMLTGEIVQQFKVDGATWSKKLYEVIYQGDMEKVSKSLKSRQMYIKKDRIFNEQEFEPENITIKSGRILLSIRFHLPFINASGDTLRKNTKVLLQLNDSLQITNFWVAPIKHLAGDFYIPRNTEMTPLLLLGDTVCLSVSYIHYGQNPVAKYNYAKFILDDKHNVVFHSYLPFTVPDDKGGITGDYNVPHMYLFNHGEHIAGSYITFPAIYNLTTNTKIEDIYLLGKSKQLKTKMDSLVFAKDINNMTFMISYFNRYNNQYYIMQCKNSSWNTYILFDNNLKHVKSVHTSPITKDEGTIFHTEKGMVYIVKFGVKKESDVYIIKQSTSNLFNMELD